MPGAVRCVRASDSGHLAAMTTFLFHGDTVRYPAIRHEVALEIMDPFLFVVRDGERSS